MDSEAKTTISRNDRLLVPKDLLASGNGRKRGRPKGSKNKLAKKTRRRARPTPEENGILKMVIPMLKILGQTEIKLTQLEELLSLGK